MVSLKAILTSSTAFFSAAFTILVNEFIPPAVRSFFSIIVHYFFTPRLTLIIEDEEDKICDKGWRAQEAHVYRPKEGRAHPLCEPLTERRPRLAHQVSESLLRKEETCPARMRLALQG